MPKKPKPKKTIGHREEVDLGELWERESIDLRDETLPSSRQPQPFYIVARNSARWVVTNEAVH